MNIATGLLTKAEATARRNIYNNPTYNKFIGVIDLIKEKQNNNDPNSFIDINVRMPDAVVSFITGTLGYAVTSTPDGTGFKRVTKIDWT